MLTRCWSSSGNRGCGEQGDGAEEDGAQDPADRYFA